MKTKLFLASASVLTMSWGLTAQAENVGVGVLEPKAVLHVKGETTNSDDVILQNLDDYDGKPDDEQLLVLDKADGERVKLIGLTDLLDDTTIVNESFVFDPDSNILTIKEGASTLTVNLSSLEDSFTDTDTNTVIKEVTYADGVITIYDSAGGIFPVNISALDTTHVNSTFVFDPDSATLSITEHETTLKVDLSSLKDKFSDTNTTITKFEYDPITNIATIIDSDFSEFTINLSELDDVDTTIKNLSASLDGTTLTITDEAGPVTVDLVKLVSGIDTDTTIKNLSASLSGTILTVTDEAGPVTVDLAALIKGVDTDTTIKNLSAALNGTTLTITDEAGPVTVDLAALIKGVDTDTTVKNLSATLDGTTLTITDEAGPVTVDLVKLVSGIDTDTTIKNLSASLEGSVLTITDEAGPITVDLLKLGGAIDTDTTIKNLSAALNGTTLTITDEAGPVTVDLAALIKGVDTDTTIKNLSATLDGTTLTITDEAGPVTVDLVKLVSGIDTDTTIKNLSAALDGTILTITDEAGPVTVDLAKIAGEADTDTFVIFGETFATATSGSQSTFYPYTAADGTSGTIVDTDSNTDISASLTDMENGSYSFQQYVVTGPAAIYESVIIDTIQNTSASLNGSLLTITDEAGDVSVDLGKLIASGDTTIKNLSATLNGTILTVTDEAGPVTVDLAALINGVDTDTTIKNLSAALDGTVLTVTDEAGPVTVDLAALIKGVDTDTTIKNLSAGLEGTVLTVTDEAGPVTVDLAALIKDVDTDTTIKNVSASLSGTILTVTDEAGPVTVDLAALIKGVDTDTTIKNVSASLSGTILTVTDEAGPVTVDLAALIKGLDVDTTIEPWFGADDGAAATSNTEDIYIMGNVGIGQTKPLYPLVVDTEKTKNVLVAREGTSESGTSGRVGINTDVPGYALDVTGDIRATGNIYSGDQFLASNFFQTSDRRLKSDIEGYNKGLEVLRQMRTVSFRYNGQGLTSNTERLHYGVIAQELEEIDPELIGSFVSPEDGTEYKTVNVQSMTYVLASALQQLDAENAAMKAQIAAQAEALAEAKNANQAMAMENNHRMAELEMMVLTMKAQLGL